MWTASAERGVPLRAMAGRSRQLAGAVDRTGRHPGLLHSPARAEDRVLRRSALQQRHPRQSGSSAKASRIAMGRLSRVHVVRVDPGARGMWGVVRWTRRRVASDGRRRQVFTQRRRRSRARGAPGSETEFFTKSLTHSVGADAAVGRWMLMTRRADEPAAAPGRRYGRRSRWWRASICALRR